MNRTLRTQSLGLLLSTVGVFGVLETDPIVAISGHRLLGLRQFRAAKQHQLEAGGPELVLISLRQNYCAASLESNGLAYGVAEPHCACAQYTHLTITYWSSAFSELRSGYERFVYRFCHRL